MKYILNFNMPDKPENIGQSQKVDNIVNFCVVNKDKLSNWEIEASGKKLTFDIIANNTNYDEATADVSGVDENGNTPTITRRGYAIITEVEDDFQNA